MNRIATLTTLTAMSLTILTLAAAQAQMPDPHHLAPAGAVKAALARPFQMAAPMAGTTELASPVSVARLATDPLPGH